MKKRLILLVAAISSILLSACSESDEISPIEMTQTVVALQITQTAIADDNDETPQVEETEASPTDKTVTFVPPETPESTATSVPTDTAVPPTVIPTDTAVPPTAVPTPTPATCIGIGCLAPDFTLPEFGGEEVSLSDFRGKSVLLNFWASWCGPCRLETPNLQKAFEQYQDKDFVILGVSTDEEDTMAEVPVFIEEYGITYPILLDTDLVIGTEYESTFNKGGIPGSYFVDSDGVIRDIVGGYMSAELIDEKVAELLEDPGSEYVASDDGYLVFDDFSDTTSGWDEDRGNTAFRRHYLNGEYHMLVNEEFIYNGALLPSYRLSNYLLEVDVRQVPGTEGYYGLIFADDPDQDAFYELQFSTVASNASVRLNQHGDDGVGPVTNWKTAENANVSGGMNHLRIILNGKNVEVFINDELVTSEVLENLPSSGSVGMFTCTCDGTRQSEVYFDNFGIKLLQ